MERWTKRIALALAVAVLAIQAWPAGRSNPPTSAGLDAPSEVTAILRRACFDCHSNETRWPWYAHVAPVSWLVVRDVEAGRDELNFSEWGSTSEGKRERRLEGVVEEIESGTMPPPGYLRMHPEARVGAAELDVLRAWARASGR